MSAYLKFFDLEQSPFEGKAQAQIVLGTRALRDAFANIQTGLAEGASRICVNGDRGLGKTSLARALPKLLGETARVALVLDPALSWDASRSTLAKQWGLESGRLARTHLLEAARDRRLVLVIDQAEQASEKFLDHLDVVLSYRSEDGQPVVQSVLLARLTTAQGEAPSPLVWWLDRIQTLQLQFSPLPREGIESYIHKHLKRAGWRGERLFSEDAAHAIHGYTGGVPGEVSELCEKLLAEAAAQDLSAIDAAFVRSICEADEEHEEEGVRTLEDEFEELMLEDEFVDADPLATALAEAEAALDDELDSREAPEAPSQAASATEDVEIVGRIGEAESYEAHEEEEPCEDERSSSMPSLAESLEHFREAEAALGPDESDTEDIESPEPDPAWGDAATPAEVDAAAETTWSEEPLGDAAQDPLDAPPTKEELRAILGSGLTPMLRNFAAAAIAAIAGGIGFAMFSGDPAPAPQADLSDSLTRTTTPAMHAKPRISIQPGEGFVTLDRLKNTGGSRAEAARPNEPSPARLDGQPHLEPLSPQPAAPAPFGHNLFGDRNADERRR